MSILCHIEASRITTDSLLTALFTNFQAPGSLLAVGCVGIVHRGTVHDVGRPKARCKEGL
jgi:hypothetical protein